MVLRARYQVGFQLAQLYYSFAGESVADLGDDDASGAAGTKKS